MKLSDKLFKETILVPMQATTKEEAIISERNVISFKASNELKQLINKNDQ